MSAVPPHLLPRRHVHDARTWTWNSELAVWIGRCSCGFPFPASIEQARALERAVDEHLAGQQHPKSMSGV